MSAVGSIFSSGNNSGMGTVQGIGGTIVGQYAGNQAASAQRHAANDAILRLQGAKGEAIGYLNPYQQTGSTALSPLSGLLTGKQYDSETGQFNTLSDTDRQALFQASPAYQFNLNEMMKSLQASQAAKGNLLSGGAQKELAQYTSGLASNEYNNYLNQLFQLAGMGQSAAGSEANAALGIGSQIAQASFAGGMGNVNKWANLSNFAYGVAGQGFNNASGGNRSNPSQLGGSSGNTEDAGLATAFFG